MISLRKISLAVVLVSLLVSSLYGKRGAPKEVKPIEKDGVIYSVPHFVGIRGIYERSPHKRYEQNGGYVLAKETKTGRLKWLTQVYVTEYNEKWEQDVQDVFITEIRLDKDNLSISDEKDRTFLLNIKTLEVTQEPSNSKFIKIDSKTIKGVIIPKEYFPDVNRMPVSGVSECWTIEKFDFEDLDNRLEKYLREEAKLRSWNKQLPNKFRNYKRQYVGVVVDGSKRIFINFFCHISGSWNDRFVQILDGGDCYFQVEYDIGTQKFLNLQINGEA
jgi:hypothetical protein